jgi:hypothetical protein
MLASCFGDSFPVACTFFLPFPLSYLFILYFSRLSFSFFYTLPLSRPSRPVHGRFTISVDRLISRRSIKLCEISSSHGGEYDVQNCLLGCTAV